MSSAPHSASAMESGVTRRLFDDENLSDGNSVQSLPEVPVTDTQSIATRPSTGQSTRSALLRRMSTSFTSRMPIDTINMYHPRAHRGPSGIPGLLSTLLPRRRTTSASASSTDAHVDQGMFSNPSEFISTPDTPNCSPEYTPPPPLPAPTLKELGLSLASLTPELLHHNVGPTNGTFLSPHYLLLCHAQGLDVIPLKSPPSVQPYALVRRVSFKAVVVMEHRGVLVAIAGRRDGVRVYALDEIKKAAQWRMDVEMRREKEKMRKEESKKVMGTSLSYERASTARKEIVTEVHSSITDKNIGPAVIRSDNFTAMNFRDDPPPYNNLPAALHNIDALSVADFPISEVFVGPSSTSITTRQDRDLSDSKALEWQGGFSDEQAIDVLTAADSGSRALDERTSTITHTNNRLIAGSHPVEGAQEASESVSPPTFSILHQALQGNRDLIPRPPTYSSPCDIRQRLDSSVDVVDDDDDGASRPGEQITLVQALMESRLPPESPPTTQSLPSTLVIHSPPTHSGRGMFSHREAGDPVFRSESRWSILEGIFSTATGILSSPVDVENVNASTLAASPHAPDTSVSYSTTNTSVTTAIIGSSDTHAPSPSRLLQIPFRFLPRHMRNTLRDRRIEQQLPNISCRQSVELGFGNQHLPPLASPPRLEYVKLPGTKGSIMIKAVETPKKSFLAILCGESGEKIELFAGTYRSALGLSRTFILPDSPRSLELQLQGDDLVEVFLVFAQNVFGLEPATVRVREVGIGRAERRAARRRAREVRSGQEVFEHEIAPDDEEANTSVNTDISVAGREDQASRTRYTQSQDSQLSCEVNYGFSAVNAEDLARAAGAKMGPYTSFQQLSFAPKFPLATIAHEYIIPPTYSDFITHRSEHEGNDTPSGQCECSPPGLPRPVQLPPSKWFYRDPKGVVHGPWKANLMQAWYNDGLLPPDLPVRKEEATDYILLKDFRQQSIDPSHPFRAVPLPHAQLHMSCNTAEPLLTPVSLLAQPRHFGPPALFFSSRGGHSTTIVDARGRSVLKGRLLWSDACDQTTSEFLKRMGDIKHLEAFDVDDRSVILAIRQGGLEVMDFGDALLKPADQSRPFLPYFKASQFNTNRRKPFIWKIGTPMAPSSAEDIVLPPTTTFSQRFGEKSMAERSEHWGDQGEGDHRDEVFFLGRKGDEVYLCEKTVKTYRVLRLSTNI